MGRFTQKTKVPFGDMDAKWKMERSAKWKVQEEKWWQLEIGIFLNPNLPATSISSSPTFEVPRIQSPEPMYFITSQKRQMGDTDPKKHGNWVRCIPLQLVCVCVCAWRRTVTLSCPSLLLQLHLLMKILPVELKSFILVGFHPDFTTTIDTKKSWHRDDKYIITKKYHF